MFNYVQNVERSYKSMISDQYVNICVQSKSWLKIYQNELIYPQKTVFFLSLSLFLSLFIRYMHILAKFLLENNSLYNASFQNIIHYIPALYLSQSFISTTQDLASYQKLMVIYLRVLIRLIKLICIFPIVTLSILCYFGNCVRVVLKL